MPAARSASPRDGPPSEPFPRRSVAHPQPASPRGRPSARAWTLRHVRDLHTDLLAAGGAATRGALRELGHSYARLRAAVAANEVIAIGRSWLALPTADAAIITALRAGGVLGGATALRSYGVWVTRHPQVQIATRPHAGRATAKSGERIWGAFELDALPWRVGLVDALSQHVRRVERAHGIASIDSALHQGLIDESDLDDLFRTLPRRCRAWRSQLDAAAASGLESLLRVPLRDRGWRVESQVPAPGGGWSDLLVDGWLYIEADGAAWHDEPKQAAKDRRRNSAIMEIGGRWLRFGYVDIVHEPARTLRLIQRVLSQGRPRVRAAR